MNTNKIKILLAKPGLDGHDVGVKVLAHALKDAGFDVVYTGLRKSSEEIVKMAIENKVDVIGLSILSGTHKIISQRIKEVMNRNNLNIPWVVGGNIPAQDVELLMKIGPTAVFATGTKVDEVVDFFKQMKEKSIR
ncbi:MAG: cobalamin B12-binding domain-containing protein [Bacteroidetes bacterium]|nr:cobalamin B12-binding domain-containing protein [Bacteroidota bacterium]